MSDINTLVLNLAVDPLGFAVLHNNTVILCIITQQQRGSSEWLMTSVTALWPHLPKIERAVVHLGRGSYTGIRSSLAFARGLSLDGVALYGVSFLESAANSRDDPLKFATPADFFRHLGTHIHAVVDSVNAPLHPLYGTDKYA